MIESSESISIKRPLVLGLSTAATRRVVLISLVGVAAVLRIYAISLYPLAGDEYGTLAEAKSVGLNWNSILYSSFMHFWIRLGNSELWLRLPSAIFGIVTVFVLIKIGERLGGWRTGALAGLIAATSPFDIYHSQELRFYSLFILATCVCMLATMNFIERRGARSRAAVLLAGAFLLLANFLGVVALYVQAVAGMFASGLTRSKRMFAFALLAIPILICGFLLTPFGRNAVWAVYRTIGNAPASSVAVTTPISIVSLFKIIFVGYVFTFGYHVYPLSYGLVITGAVLIAVLLILGTRKMWKQTNWGAMPFAYLLTLIILFLVLDAVAGRVANGISPRHVAFIWPTFIVVLAVGLASLSKRVRYILATTLVALNSLSIGAAWQKDWTYGSVVDYRAAAEYTSRAATGETAIINDGRSKDEIAYYFPKQIPLLNSWSFVNDPDSIKRLSFSKLIMVTDDWQPERRRDADRLVRNLTQRYSITDSYVDYPFSEYFLERKPNSDSAGYEFRGASNQLDQPLSNYGIEFQDLHLPAKVSVKGFSLSILGAYGLPDLDQARELNLPLAHPKKAKHIILLTNVINGSHLESGEAIGSLSIDRDDESNVTYPLRLGTETTTWDKRCETGAPCETVFQWRKRLAIVGQNAYEGSMRDFSAGIHAVVLPLTDGGQVTRITVRYAATSGQLYVWAVALSED